MRRTFAVLLAVLVIQGASGSPAGAQTKVRQDARGDAPALSDITSVKVQNNRKNLAVTVRIAHVVRGRTTMSFAFGRTTATEDDRREFYVTTEPEGRRWTTGAGHLTTEDGSPWRCETFRTRVETGRHGFIRVVIPQRCLGQEAGRQRVNVTVNDARQGDAAWLPPKGTDDLGVHPPLADSYDGLSHLIRVRRGR